MVESLAAEMRHFSGLNTRLVVTHVRDRLGDDGVRDLLAGSCDDRPVEVLLDDASWSTYSQFRSVLESAGRLLAEHGGLSGMVEVQNIGRTTSPEIAQTLLAFGSPMVMALATADLAPSFYSVLAVHPEAAGIAHLRWRRRMLDGFEPFPELCAFLGAASAQGVRLFGMRVLEVTEVSCQCRGDDECVTEVRWDETEDLSMQLDRMQTRMEIAESRLEAFQQTVNDIVSADDLATVLSRIVSSAARAMHARGFVLSVNALTDGRRLFTSGVTVEEAEELLAADTGLLSVDVASTRQHYGRIVAVADTSLASYEEASLVAYARLAATALDSAFALEQARRQAQTAESLLHLSTSLAELTSVQELASRLAKAIPDVIDADCAAVLLISDGCARVAAHHGYSREAQQQLEQVAIPAATLDLLPPLHRQERDHMGPLGQPLMDAAGLKAMAAAPLTVDGTAVGLLVAAVRHDSERILDDSKLAERFAGLAGQATVALRNSHLLDQIRHQSLHDPLTDLPNRALILDRAEQMLARTRREHHACAALFIDLDGFKEINDTLGHEVGDQVLRHVSASLASTLRGNDTVGRLGGDEFVVLVDGSSHDVGLDIVAERLLEAVRTPLYLPSRDRPIVVSASIGIAVGERPSAAELLRDADIALYRAKVAGKGCHRLFAPEMRSDMLARAALGERLADAVVNHEFFLVYQPILDLATEVTVGVEALLRWSDPEHGVVAPDAFIPMLEETGLINDVGRWVLGEACRQFAALSREGHDVTMSVNASVRQLERPQFVDEVVEALRSSGTPAQSLIIEITETAIMRDPDAALAVLTQLKSLGVGIAIDDFATGYSSIAHLRQFPVGTLKIDRSFVAALTETAAADELVHTLIGLGKSLRIRTSAEGIENRAQLEQLLHEGCDTGQGYLFAPPLEPADLADFLDREHDATRLSPASTR